MEKLIINFSIEKKEMNAEGYINFCKTILHNLQSFDSIFKTLNVINVKHRESFFFKTNLADFSTENLKLIIHEQKDIVYNNPDASNNQLTDQSMSWLGFSSTFFFGGEKSIEDIPDVGLSVSQGAINNIPAFLKFDYSDKLQEKLSEEYIINLIKAIYEVVEVKFTNVITNAFFLKVRRKGKHAIGWINYSNDKRIIEHLTPSDIKIQSEQGIIFSICQKDLFKADNLMVVEKAIEISDYLAMNKS